MAHPLGELALLVPAVDAAVPAQLAVLESELHARDVATHRTPLGSDPAAAVRAELTRGTRLLVHCGGQRSLLDVVPALFRDGVQDPADAVLGVFAGGASNDFAMTFGLTRSPEGVAALLASDVLMRVDIGRVTCQTSDRAAQHYVVNGAVVGLEAHVARLARGGRVGNLLSWWTAAAAYRRPRVDIEMSKARWSGRLVQVRIANGQFALDRLQVAPLALPDDGLWDVQVWEGPRHLPFSLQPKMVRGEHLPHEHVTEWRQERVEVSASPPAPVAVDGRYVGRTPAVFELLPKALRLKV